jgi:hypothetical protein
MVISGGSNCRQLYNIRNIKMTTEPQYIETIKKGHTVIYGNKHYRVQDDGKGYLHIIAFEDGRRKKISLEKIILFQYGTYQDWVFNEWWRIYPNYKLFKDYATHEIAVNK